MIHELAPSVVGYNLYDSYPWCMFDLTCMKSGNSLGGMYVDLTCMKSTKICIMYSVLTLS